MGGTALALATLGAGTVSAAWGADSAYWLAAAMSAAALGAAVVLGKIWKGGPLAGQA
jgi:hypothetical protein